jgi:hypothetical protein
MFCVNLHLGHFTKILVKTQICLPIFITVVHQSAKRGKLLKSRKHNVYYVKNFSYLKKVQTRYRWEIWNVYLTASEWECVSRVKLTRKGNAKW